MSVFLQPAFISPGGGELVLIALVLLMLFGAKDVPRMLRKINDFFFHIRRVGEEFKHELMYSDLLPKEPPEPPPHAPPPEETEEEKSASTDESSPLKEEVEDD